MNKRRNNADTDLRIPGVRRGRKITLTVDGEPIVAHEGETVHGALAAAGIQILGQNSKTRSPRGILCGMGICYQCRVTINGIPDQRACMTPATDHMMIETGHVDHAVRDDSSKASRETCSQTSIQQSHIQRGENP